MEFNLFKLGSLFPEVIAGTDDDSDFTGTLLGVGAVAIPYTAQIFSLANGQAFTPVSFAAGQPWALDLEGNDPALFSVKFSAKGYKPLTLLLSQLYSNHEIILKKDLLADIALEAAFAMALLTLAQSKKKKVGALTTGDVIPVILIFSALMGFSVIKKILEFLGIFKSADTSSLDAASTNPNYWWNPNYWKTVLPSGSTYSYAITQAVAESWCQEIYNAVGMFNDDEEAIIAVFKRCHTRANGSFLCYIFSQLYGEDLLTWLRGGIWPQDRLSDADVNTINNYVNNLPKY